ncbi:hypothetical protein NY08_1607 [Rhodococcus sp. B7740]|nr:hypothetical protein NY08_1607 [Rhodococcus sp. B7740]
MVDRHADGEQSDPCEVGTDALGRGGLHRGLHSDLVSTE